MKRIAASLAAVLLSSAAGGLAACGGSGAEPDAPVDGAPMTLVLDFQPNAVHAGIYKALADGDLAARGVDLDVQAPGASTDGPKLLQAGRADLAVMDIQDLAIARERGADLVGVGALVQRPLAAVIAADAEATGTPLDLVGGTVGVTGLPSDDAVLEAVMDSVDPDGEVERPDTVTIGFDSIAALSAGRVDAATAFWNVEGVALRENGVPTREFRVDDYGAPAFPELILVTTREQLDSERDLVGAVVAGLHDGYGTAADDPEAAVAAEADAVPELDPDTLAAQMDALEGAFSPPLELDRKVLEEWADYVVDYGIVAERPDLDEAFDLTLAKG
jgi:NitT/TauT family transport system substrate-binding protein/putative hydroxymethylpyrimidine transport system substrate-binding protein